MAIDKKELYIAIVGAGASIVGVILYLKHSNQTPSQTVYTDPNGGVPADLGGGGGFSAGSPPPSTALPPPDTQPVIPPDSASSLGPVASNSPFASEENLTNLENTFSGVPLTPISKSTVTLEQNTPSGLEFAPGTTQVVAYNPEGADLQLFYDSAGNLIDASPIRSDGQNPNSSVTPIGVDRVRPVVDEPVRNIPPQNAPVVTPVRTPVSATPVLKPIGPATPPPPPVKPPAPIRGGRVPSS